MIASDTVALGITSKASLALTSVFLEATPFDIWKTVGTHEWFSAGLLGASRTFDEFFISTTFNWTLVARNANSIFIAHVARFASACGDAIFRYI